MTGQTLAKLWSLVIGAFFVLNTAASAQFMEEIKGVKFGIGCQTPIKALEAGLGTCLIAETRARVWCPNGKVYERTGELPQVALVRSACGLKQIL